MAFNVNSPRYQEWFIQQQTTLLQFNNSSGTWSSTGAQLLRVDAGSATATRNAPYSPFPVLTGTRSIQAGVRGRKIATWSIRGLPVIPSGTGGTAPDMDVILQNIFGQVSATPAGSGATATFTVTSGAVTAVTITAPGSGYTQGAVGITFPTGTGASAVVIVSPGGTVTGAVVTNGGTGYTAGTATILATTAANAYSFLDTGYPAFSLLGFINGFTTLIQRALWGCFVTRATFNFNGPFFTVDLDGFAGYEIDNIGFSQFDTQALAGLTSFPTKPSSPTIAGQPIQGFGNGYAMAIHSQQMNLKIRAMSVVIETGHTPVTDVYGSAYLVEAVGGTRSVTINLGDLLDDDSAALNDLKTQADMDLAGTGIQAAIVTGNSPGSTVAFSLNSIQPNAFGMRDSGATVSFELPTSMAHPSGFGLTNELNMVFS